MFKLTRKNSLYPAGFAILLFFVASFIPPVRASIFAVVRNPLCIFTALGREITGVIFYHRNLVLNERLRARADYFINQLNSMHELTRENTRLNELLALKKKAAYRVVAAHVIGRDPDNWSSAIIIDKGSGQGIRRNLAVVTYLGLVGKVVEVSTDSSRVMLISDPAVGVSAIVQRSRQEGLVSGTLGSSLLMRYLPENADIRVSDIVVTSGLAEYYPKGLLIGIVATVSDEFSGLSRYAIIKPAVNLSTIEEVLVVFP